MVQRNMVNLNIIILGELFGLSIIIVGLIIVVPCVLVAIKDFIDSIF